MLGALSFKCCARSLLVFSVPFRASQETLFTNEHFPGGKKENGSNGHGVW